MRRAAAKRRIRVPTTLASLKRKIRNVVWSYLIGVKTDNVIVKRNITNMRNYERLKL